MLDELLPPDMKVYTLVYEIIRFPNSNRILKCANVFLAK